jgi:hypothetical protein
MKEWTRTLEFRRLEGHERGYIEQLWRLGDTNKFEWRPVEAVPLDDTGNPVPRTGQTFTRDGAGRDIVPPIKEA